MILLYNWLEYWWYKYSGVGYSTLCVHMDTSLQDSAFVVKAESILTLVNKKVWNALLPSK